jgi:hypothetical protein
MDAALALHLQLHALQNSATFAQLDDVVAAADISTAAGCA